MTTTQRNVLLLENIHPCAATMLREHGFNVEVHNEPLGAEELIAKLKDTTLLGLRCDTQITADVVARAPHLKAIGVFSVGTNNIDLAACKHAEIPVFNSPFGNTRAVVEVAIGSIIMLLRNAFDQSTTLHREGAWHKTAKGAHEVRGKKLGIIGYGNIGSQLSTLAEALGMDVYFYDAFDRPALGRAQRCHTLAELLPIADVLSVHVDGRPDNTAFIGAREIALMKDGAILINLSRGNTVDEHALAEAITSGKLAGAAVDVFLHEPKNDGDILETPLRGLHNVILTPHVGGLTEEGWASNGEYVARKLIDYIETGKTNSSVNLR